MNILLVNPQTQVIQKENITKIRLNKKRVTNELMLTLVFKNGEANVFAIGSNETSIVLEINE